jgi:hypothetical protein
MGETAVRTRAHLALVSLAMMAFFVLVAAIPPSAADGRGGGRGGGGNHGGWHRGGWHGGFRGPRFFVGSTFWFPGPYAYPYPVYAPPVYAPPVVVEPPPPVYIEQRSPAYWYYCQNPPGYYPYVGTCADEWLQVAPQPSAPAP